METVTTLNAAATATNVLRELLFASQDNRKVKTWLAQLGVSACANAYVAATGRMPTPGLVNTSVKTWRRRLSAVNATACGMLAALAALEIYDREVRQPRLTRIIDECLEEILNSRTDDSHREGTSVGPSGPSGDCGRSPNLGLAYSIAAELAKIIAPGEKEERGSDPRP